MPKTLTIEIEADEEESLYCLLGHICREVIEGKSYNNQDVESNAKFGGEWLTVLEGDYKGKYKWLREL